MSKGGSRSRGSSKDLVGDAARKTHFARETFANAPTTRFATFSVIWKYMGTRKRPGQGRFFYPQTCQQPVDKLGFGDLEGGGAGSLHSPPAEAGQTAELPREVHPCSPAQAGVTSFSTSCG